MTFLPYNRIKWGFSAPLQGLALQGLGDVPFPARGEGLDVCEAGYYRVVHSGQSVIERGEQIDGAVRIFRSQIKSFDIVGRVAKADGTLVFEMLDGRKFRLIDRFNADEYVIGYIVEPCPLPFAAPPFAAPCAPCPTGCTTVTKNEVYYARKSRKNANDIPIQMNRRIIKCEDSASAPRPSCQDEIFQIKQRYKV